MQYAILPIADAPQPGTRPEEEVLTDENLEWKLILFNDDVNTFDYVINCLIEICGHTTEQAEQLTLMVHYKGKAVVKTGSEEELLPMCNSLCERGLSAEMSDQ
jgi:ATP-dependent Clp protease adaptor protein ClpS